MFKKDDLVKGKVSGAVYKCLKDESLDNFVFVECITNSPKLGSKAVKGYRVKLPSENIDLYAPAAESSKAQEELKEESLVDLRRSLKRFLIGG